MNTRRSIIVAMGRNSVIGKNGQMPWHLPADLRHFKRTTMGKPVIMGRKTFDSIGKPLPGRRVIVISGRIRDYPHDDVQFVGSIADAFAAAGEVEEVMIAGGAEIYRQTLDDADRLYITRIDQQFDGDTFFPTFDPLEWIGSKAESHEADDANPYRYDFLRFDRFS